MKNLPTRPQLRRELAHGALAARAALAEVRAFTIRNRDMIALIVIGTLLLLALATALINAMADDDRQPPGPAVVTTPAVPGPAPARQPGRPPAGAGPNPGGDVGRPEAPSATSHVVVRGETLAALAMRYGVPYEEIAAHSRIADPHRITAGQRLVIPEPVTGIEVIEPGTTLTFHARRLGLGLDELAALNPHITDPDRIPAGGTLLVAP